MGKMIAKKTVYTCDLCSGERLERELINIAGVDVCGICSARANIDELWAVMRTMAVQSRPAVPARASAPVTPAEGTMADG
jgi:hypothetical protein